MTTIVDGSNGVSYPLGGATQTTGMGPAFSAYFNGNTQSISASTWTKVTMNAKDFDTNSNYDAATNYRFTPTVAGYYIITSVISWTQSAANTWAGAIAIYKNGSLYKGINSSAISGNFNTQTISIPILFNGSTDYVESWVWSNQSMNLAGSTYSGGAGTNANNSLFNGYLIRGA